MNVDAAKNTWSAKTSQSPPFLRLDERFALGADDLQWILYKSRHKTGPALDAPLELQDWFPVSFVRSTKEILCRCIREKGCFPSIQAQTALDGIPSTFDAWKVAVPAPELAE